jgi:uncharacterized membrane protein YjjP (DUF1212 family)
LEDALIDFELWDRKAEREPDGEPTRTECLKVIRHIRTEKPELNRVLRTDRLVTAIKGSQLGIDSPTTDRVFRELKRSA